MFPPLWLYLKFGTAEKPGPGLWLPLFLVWLILLPIVVLVLVITIVVDLALFAAGRPYHYYTILMLSCLAVVSAARGLVVSIHHEETDIAINLV